MNCNCHCHGKCKLLGGLEQKIMDVLWSSDSPQKPADVLKKMTGDYAYTTIMTVLKRMSDKKLIKRELSGNAYLYTPNQDKTTYACECLEDLFTRLFDSYGVDAVTSFKKVATKLGFSI